MAHVLPLAVPLDAAVDVCFDAEKSLAVGIKVAARGRSVGVSSRDSNYHAATYSDATSRATVEVTVCGYVLARAYRKAVF